MSAHGTALALWSGQRRAYTVRCYFYAEKPGEPTEIGDGVVSFCLPEVNITFRARYRGTSDACDYAALLALLEFVEINPKLFEGKALEIYGDSFAVVNQVNQQLLCKKDLEPFRNLALIFKRKIPYVLNWVPPADNPAQGVSASE
jgi:hypothetical protein